MDNEKFELPNASELIAIESFIQTYDNLGLVISAIDHHGSSPGLLAIADPIGTLAKALNADLSTFSSEDLIFRLGELRDQLCISHEGLFDTIRSVSRSVISHESMLIKEANDFLTHTKQHTFHAGKTLTITVRDVPPAAKLKEVISVALSATSFLSKMLQRSTLPKTAAEYQAWQLHVKQQMVKIGPVYRFVMTDRGFQSTVSSSSLFGASAPSTIYERKSSLHALGYTSDAYAHEIADGMKKIAAFDKHFFDFLEKESATLTDFIESAGLHGYDKPTLKKVRHQLGWLFYHFASTVGVQQIGFVLLRLAHALKYAYV